MVVTIWNDWDFRDHDETPRWLLKFVSEIPELKTPANTLTADALQLL